MTRFATSANEALNTFHFTAKGTVEAIKHADGPWWVADDYEMRFFRPLSSALYWIDYHLFGSAAWLWHVHSLLWGLAAVLTVFGIYSHLLPQRRARLGGLFFGLAL